MNLLVNRKTLKPNQTIGEFDIDGQPFCFTCEDTVRPDGEKVQNETAIPAGRYRVRMTWSNRFKKIMPELMNVPNFAGVRIHGGNTEADTEGCILVGMHLNRAGIDTCPPAVEHIYDVIAAAELEEEVWLSVMNP